jgi:hypothetical protein
MSMLAINPASRSLTTAGGPLAMVWPSVAADVFGVVAVGNRWRVLARRALEQSPERRRRRLARFNTVIDDRCGLPQGGGEQYLPPSVGQAPNTIATARELRLRGRSPTMTANTAWQLNRILNAVGLFAAVALLIGLVVVFVRSVVGEDPHGYALIFSVILGIVLLLPLVLLSIGAYRLRLRRRSGIGCQLVAGVVVGLYSAPMPLPGRWIGVGLGTLFVVAALAGLLTRDRLSGASGATYDVERP